MSETLHRATKVVGKEGFMDAGDIAGMKADGWEVAEVTCTLCKGPIGTDDSFTTHADGTAVHTEPEKDCT